jgi:hypothetical protein
MGIEPTRSRANDPSSALKAVGPTRVPDTPRLVKTIPVTAGGVEGGRTRPAGGRADRVCALVHGCPGAPGEAHAPVWALPDASWKLALQCGRRLMGAGSSRSSMGAACCELEARAAMWASPGCGPGTPGGARCTRRRHARRHGGRGRKGGGRVVVVVMHRTVRRNMPRSIRVVNSGREWLWRPCAGGTIRQGEDRVNRRPHPQHCARVAGGGQARKIHH